MREMWAHHGIRNCEEYVNVVRAGLARQTQLLKRDTDQTKVNPINKWVASVLQSNMDLQIILDIYACASYVVEYTLAMQTAGCQTLAAK